MSAFPPTATIADEVRRALDALGVDPAELAGDVPVRTPITGEVIGPAGTTQH